MARADRPAFRATGNAAFDSYKADTLKRLEEEQEAFEGFLQRLRQAKTSRNFDSFMEDRARRTRDAATAPEAGAEPAALPHRQRTPRRILIPRRSSGRSLRPPYGGAFCMAQSGLRKAAALLG